MPAEATTPTGGISDIGDTWLLGVVVRTDDADEPDDVGDLVDATVAITVTKPDDSTVPLAVAHDGLGRYSAGYVVTGAGRHFAVAAVSGAVVSVVAYATNAIGPGEPPDVPQLRAYLKESGAKFDDAELAEVLEAELENQADVCDVPAVYPTWARRALLRRCARALAMKSLPLAMPQGDAETGPRFLPRNDPEVVRYEGPHRKVSFA